MIEATEGQLEIDGRSSWMNLSVRRNGYVIQQDKPNASIWRVKDIVLVPKLLKWTKEKDKRAKELIKLVSF